MTGRDAYRYELTWAHDLRHEGRALAPRRWLLAQITGPVAGWMLHDGHGHLIAVHAGAFDHRNDARIAQGWANGVVASEITGDVLIDWAEQDGFAPWIGRRWIGKASRITDVRDAHLGPVLQQLTRSWTAMIDAIAPSDGHLVVGCLDAESYYVVAFMLDAAGARRVEAQQAALAARVGAPLQIERGGHPHEELLQLTVRDPRVVWMLGQDIPAEVPGVRHAEAFTQVLVAPLPAGDRLPALAGGGLR